MTFDAIRAYVIEDLEQVNGLIHQRLDSDVVLIQQLGRYIVNSGGKRIRPLLTLLVGRLLGVSAYQRCQLAAILEFIHTATLLHDDVVDESTLRRGQQTANALFGNAASVLVGDFLYTRSFEMMTELKSPRVMEIMASVTNKIAEGEVMQLMHCGDAQMTEAAYMNVIYCKTAKLFEAACITPAALAQSSESKTQALLNYGQHLGTAFQLMDDVIDYSSDPDQMGKNLGDDLAEGKPTLPLIYAMRVGTPSQRQQIQNAIIENRRDKMADILHILDTTKALAYCIGKVQAEAETALMPLNQYFPDSPERQALNALANLASKRNG